ncbi:MAG: polyhydroxybutyrate depolymerase [Gemmataceae bacterium]|nr:polyhydroxybutyrate depolymerase [Gemmataceae bacterium]
MIGSLLLISALFIAQPESLGEGNHKRQITVDDLKRLHWIHVPAKYDAKKAMPIVLALHGAMMDAKMMEAFCQLNATADKHGFIVVYPNGTGPGGFLQTWNAGLFPGDLNKQKVDDVKYLAKVLDDVIGSLNVDTKRVYITGLSNGGMMSYRLAAEMSERIAAIAPVAGTMAIEKYEPKRPIPVVHFHGTKDTLVPYDGPPKKKDIPTFLKFRSVNDTILACVKANGCDEKATESEVESKADKLRVTRKAYPAGRTGADVILYTIETGGHTWPGNAFSPAFLGTNTSNISANEVMWEFFARHALK